jgi:hypothetical protein
MIPPKGLGSIPSFIRNFSRFNIWVCLKIRQDIMVHHCFHSKFFLVFRSLGYLPLWTIPPIVGFLRYLSPKNNQMVGPIEWKIPILVPVDGSVTVLPQVSPKKNCVLRGGPVSSSAKTVAPVEASTSELNAGETVARNRGPNKQTAIASEIFWIPMILPSHGFQPHWMFLLKTKPQTSGVNKNWLCGWNRRIYGYLWMETRWKRSW